MQFCRRVMFLDGSYMLESSSSHALRWSARVGYLHEEGVADSEEQARLLARASIKSLMERKAKEAEVTA